MAHVAEAQVRGVYPTGMSATNAGVMPDAGLTYSNLFIFNARDESKGADGEVVATGTNAVMIDLNTFVWVSRRHIIRRREVLGRGDATGVEQLARV